MRITNSNVGKTTENTNWGQTYTIDRKEIGNLFLLPDSCFNHVSRRFEAIMEAEVELGKKIEDIQVIPDF